MLNIGDELLSVKINDFLYEDNDEMFDYDEFITYNTKNEIEQHNDTTKTNQLINYDDKLSILNNVQKRMLNIINDSSTLYFKEIVSIISILSLDEKFNIITSFDNYDYEELNKLFRKYENILIKSFEDKVDFKINFSLYVTLLELFNEICIINSVDLRRKDTINNILESISETINILKSISSSFVFDFLPSLSMKLNFILDISFLIVD